MRDSDRPMTQREAYQRGYAAGYAAAQSGPPREPTREIAADPIDRVLTLTAKAEIERLRADLSVANAEIEEIHATGGTSYMRLDRLQAERDTLAAIVRAADEMHLKPTMDNINAWADARAKWEGK